ncbi:MAG: S8 family serine peptidase [Cyanobacteria bacterium J06638_22]
MINIPPTPATPQTTGRYLVVLNDEDISAGVRAIENATGVSEFAHSGDFEDRAIAPEELASEHSIMFDELGVMVMSLDPDQVRSLSTTTVNEHLPLSMEPERVVYALPEADPFRRMLPAEPPAIRSAPFGKNVNVSLEYLKGYRDAITQLVEHLSPESAGSRQMDGEVPAIDTPLEEITWGLQRTRVDTSCYTGAGIRVAVLDTGMDLEHPDFASRSIQAKSFINGETAQDGNGHGTHCIGTACGGQGPTSPRYGVARECEIYAGKVLSDAGAGSDGGILAGINWAIASGCSVVSMSLGARVQPGQGFSRVYERVGKRSLRRGTLIIAAAGNDSWRDNGIIQPVSHPANCPSIMAVGALNEALQVAQFSNGGLNPRGGQIDLIAPGVEVFSAWPMPVRYYTISGTSMATPHVSGIAALFAQATGAKGSELWTELVQAAQRLPLPSRDVGSGLAQATQ